jgi:hypothetical protein
MARKQYLDRELVFHAYDNLIERCARLNSFSGNLVKNFVTDDIDAREKSLALDDIITLSISARRLISVCGIASNHPKMSVKKLWFHLTNDLVTLITLDDNVSLQQLFGIVIHCESLEIIDSDMMARLYFDSRDGTETLALYASKVLEEKFFTPKILIKSDKSDKLLFDIGEIISCIDQNLLPTVIEISQKHRLFLESDYRI